MKRTFQKVLLVALGLSAGFFGMALLGRPSPVKGQAYSLETIRLERELKQVQEERQAAQKNLQKIQQRLEQQKEQSAKLERQREDLRQETLRYQLLNAQIPSQGPGIEIQFQDAAPGSHESVLIYEYDMLLSVINKLNAAGAEAISLNNERITADSFLKIKSQQLTVSDRPLLPPFVIRAVGEPESLESAITLRYSTLWQLRTQYQLPVQVYRRENLQMPAKPSPDLLQEEPSEELPGAQQEREEV